MGIATLEFLTSAAADSTWEDVKFQFLFSTSPLGLGEADLKVHRLQFLYGSFQLQILTGKFLTIYIDTSFFQLNLIQHDHDYYSE